ncbi:ABC transporter ATP-binding protein [Austwickia chelonae]|uniref:ABC transporter ATP-binding protein n=1 Tax=Austwickia chelonae TaxID=100225 RepID=UPI000E242AFC|nr:ABC transporter ATP-binding protein [Austwickia chelonae]
MLNVEGLCKSFGERSLWSDLSFSVAPGTMAAITGRSGTGKTTLLNCLGAIDHPSSGSIWWKGEDLCTLSERRRRLLRRRDLGYLFQDYALVDNESADTNIGFAVTPPWPWARKKFPRQLARVGLEDIGSRPVYQLSGGEQQRVAMARVLAKQPTLVLADEPTGALDEKSGEVVVSLLRELADDGAVVVIATHQDSVRLACDEWLDLDAMASLAGSEDRHSD